MVQSYPFEDLVRIPTEQAIECLNILHEMVTATDSNVYVHCIAGWNRSPTIVWLYLIACGIDPREAKTRIESVSYDAVPAHSKLVDKELTDAVIRYGHRYFLPHLRPESILPVTHG